jgi:hypothetical protein
VGSDEERAAQDLADELKRLRVEDVLIQTLVTVSAIGYRGLGATPETQESRDLAQARLAIDTMQALTPVLERVMPPELVRDFSTSVANLQLAYARVAAEDAAGGAPPPSGESAAESPDEPADETAEDPSSQNEERQAEG